MKKFLFVLLICISFTSCLPRSFYNWHSKYKGDIDEMYLVQDANNRINSYDWYYDMYNQIEAQKANYSSMKKDDPQHDSVRMVLNNMIGQYNSRTKQYNHNLWMPNNGDIPQSIDLIKGDEK